ncbi:unnamed protein product [Prorocentrum cordatum]|uniref:Uncharacterized protein n=1 Tax=Prorocentrum cordatum TaxID=2364126 RepID=A0ABN9R196_9DINO|nr:unnamed protein product [Polarella glacialis]
MHSESWDGSVVCSRARAVSPRRGLSSGGLDWKVAWPPAAWWMMLRACCCSHPSSSGEASGPAYLPTKNAYLLVLASFCSRRTPLGSLPPFFTAGSTSGESAEGTWLPSSQMYRVLALLGRVQFLSTRTIEEQSR